MTHRLFSPMLCLLILCIGTMPVAAQAERGDPRPPPNLTPKAQSWFGRYMGLNRARLEFCVHIRREYAAERVHRCIPFGPPLTAKDAELMGLAGLLPPLDTLTRADRERLTPWIRTYTSSAVDEAYYDRFDPSRYPGLAAKFAAEEDRVREAMRNQRQRVIARGEAVARKGGWLALILGTLFLVFRGMRRRRSVSGRFQAAPGRLPTSEVKPAPSDDIVPGGNR